MFVLLLKFFSWMTNTFQHLLPKSMLIIIFSSSFSHFSPLALFTPKTCLLSYYTQHFFLRHEFWLLPLHLLSFLHLSNLGEVMDNKFCLAKNFSKSAKAIQPGTLSISALKTQILWRLGSKEDKVTGGKYPVLAVCALPSSFSH